MLSIMRVWQFAAEPPPCDKTAHTREGRLTLKKLKPGGAQRLALRLAVEECRRSALEKDKSRLRSELEKVLQVGCRNNRE